MDTTVQVRQRGTLPYLRTKMPKALPAFQLLVSRCLQVVADPKPSDVQSYVGLADEKDLRLFAAKQEEGGKDGVR